jgi:hypothetical protein
MSTEMQQCVEDCLSCHKSCLQMAMNHCLEKGGDHLAPDHFKLMLACAEICQACANFMLIGTPHHRHICKECAELCQQCAQSCEKLGDMQECVAACRHCAESCRLMAA